MQVYNHCVFEPDIGKDICLVNKLQGKYTVKYNCSVRKQIKQNGLADNVTRFIEIQIHIDYK